MSYADIKERFNSFTDKTYATQYKADMVYKLLEDFLDEFVKDGDVVMEVGCGSTCPATVHLARTKSVTSYCFEPSAMAESAKEVLAKLPVKAKGIKQDEPGERPYFIHRLPAHEVEKANPPKCDVLIFNRMIHEWRLFEQNMGLAFDVPTKLHEMCDKFLKPGGLLIVGDFMYERGVEGDLLKKEMEDLKKRLGHTHPPSEYVTLEDVREGVKFGSGYFEVKSSIIGRVESDTHRQYWMICAAKETSA